MKNSNKKYGFTLIELMVAVIIIAVLAAVAVPQYKKAVLKSRFSTLMPVANSLAKGNEVYYLSQGEYSTEESKLDVEGQVSAPEGTEITLETDPEYLSYVRVANDSKVPNARYVVYQQHSKNFAGTTMCEANDDTAKELCQSLGGVFVSANGTESGWSSYLLSGELQAGDAFEVPCPANSTECNNDGEATGCESGYYIDGGACSACPANSTCGDNGEITGCNHGYYVNGNACEACTGEQPPDRTASKSGAKGTATCVNGEWVYQWTNGRTYNENQLCNGDYTCAGATFSRDGSGVTCRSNTSTTGCVGSTFTNGATCEGAGCSYSTFIGNNQSVSATTCQTFYAYGCSNSTFSGEQTYCWGSAANACAGSTFKRGSYCVPIVEGACDGVNYEGGWCQGEGGNFYDYKQGYCPAGSPKKGGGVW